MFSISIWRRVSGDSVIVYWTPGCFESWSSIGSRSGPWVESSWACEVSEAGRGGVVVIVRIGRRWMWHERFCRDAWRHIRLNGDAIVAGIVNVDGVYE